MSVRALRAVILGVPMVLAGQGCAVTAGTVPPARYYQLDAAGPVGGVDPSVAIAIKHVLFFHPECPRSGIEVRRVSDDRRYAELLVCGTVRRYQDITPGLSSWDTVIEGPTWIEVTQATSG